MTAMDAPVPERHEHDLGRRLRELVRRRARSTPSMPRPPPDAKPPPRPWSDTDADWDEES